MNKKGAAALLIFGLRDEVISDDIVNGLKFVPAICPVLRDFIALVIFPCRAAGSGCFAGLDFSPARPKSGGQGVAGLAYFWVMLTVILSAVILELGIM